MMTSRLQESFGELFFGPGWETSPRRPLASLYASSS
jgi:hypothetical protein